MKHVMCCLMIAVLPFVSPSCRESSRQQRLCNAWCSCNPRGSCTDHQLDWCASELQRLIDDTTCGDKFGDYVDCALKYNECGEAPYYAYAAPACTDLMVEHMNCAAPDQIEATDAYIIYCIQNNGVECSD